MQPAPADPVGLKAELARSIEATLLREARRNERAIATVRVGMLVLLCGVEAWLLSGPSLLGWLAWPSAALTVSWLVVAIGLLSALRRGWYTPALAFVMPLLDALVIATRVGVVFAVGGAPLVMRSQELATIGLLSSLLAVTGAFRLQPSAVWWSSGLGLAMYVFFAAWFGLSTFHASVHVVILLAVGGAAAQLTRIVSRAVHQEVTRLTLRRLLPATVLDAADADPMALLTEPRSVDATVVITDLRGFTGWAERRAPLQVLEMLNEVQGMLSAAVLAEGGTVDKFMGDGMLAVFGAPRALPDHADRALAAVRRMRDGMARFPDLALGIGVHSGEVVVGCVGSGIRMEFTVLGDTVNTASRLEAATKQLGVPILVSEATRGRATVALEPRGDLTLRGREDAVTVWSLPA